MIGIHENMHVNMQKEALMKLVNLAGSFSLFWNTKNVHTFPLKD